MAKGYIYKGTNKINGKSYIGQTIKSIEERWRQHCYYEKHDECPKLNRAIAKYGIENFELSLVEECQIEELNEKEIFWISQYDSFHNGYNSTFGGDVGYRFDYDEICKEYSTDKNIANICKKFNCSYGTVITALNTNSVQKEPWEKSVQMIDPKTLEVKKTFSSLTEAAKYFDGAVSTIKLASSGERDSAFGYFWRYAGDDEKVFESKTIYSTSNEIIVQYDKSGNYIKSFKTIADANRSLNKPFNHKSIGNVCNGRAKTAHGYVWKREKIK